jgi:hypothetical protein
VLLLHNSWGALRIGEQFRDLGFRLNRSYPPDRRDRASDADDSGKYSSSGLKD